MSKARVAILKVITNELTVTATAAQYGYSRQHLHRLLTRYRDGGLDAVDPQPPRPRANPRATSPAVREEIIDQRLHLTKDGLDAGPVTIAWHLTQPRHALAGHIAPSTSTIRRILHDAGLTGKADQVGLFGSAERDSEESRSWSLTDDHAG